MSREQLAFSFDEPDVPQPYTLTCADVLTWAQNYTGPKFMACLCDPPYSLGNGKKGFMNARWDTDLAFQPDTWKALAQHLLPGAFIMAFASSRGFHRVMTAMEDAGLRLYPAIFGWLTGQSFPKATRIDTQIDAAVGAERIVVGRQKALGNARGKGAAGHYANGIPSMTGEGYEIVKDGWDLTAPATPLAQAWAGHRYGGQMLKNSLEPIIVAQVPYQGKPVQSITQNGAGALNIAGSRVGVGEQWWERGDAPDDEITRMMRQRHSGRWPPNFALVHTPECVQVGTRQVRGSHDTTGVWGKGHGYDGGWGPDPAHQAYTDANGQEEVAAWHCAPGCVVAKLDATAGVLRPSWVKPRHRIAPKFQGIYNGGKVSESLEGTTSPPEFGDIGGPSRFFHVSDFSLDVAEQLAQADPVRYCAKASRGERNKGLEEMPATKSSDDGYGSIQRPILERATPREHWTPHQTANNHPTVKPLTLCQWLATLLLPPAAYAPRRLLVPFSGTSSEMIGALQAGWDEVFGIEADQSYINLAERRLAYWAGR